MQQRQLGADGPMLSAVGIGCNTFGVTAPRDTVADIVATALDIGITHFDTAQSYGNGESERLLGWALGRRRDQVCIATKAPRRPAEEPWRPGRLTAHIVESCHASLERLGTDVIDLYYEHHRDPEAPIDEVLEAFDRLVTAGKVRWGGCSNAAASDLAAAATVAREHSWPHPAAAQFEWSLLARSCEDELVPTARRHGIGVVPYFPLASGVLTGKYRLGAPFPPGSRLDRLPRFAGMATDANLAIVSRLARFADEHQRTLPELAVAWLLAHPEVTSVITGVTSPAQVMANAAGANWSLSSAERDRVADLCLEPDQSEPDAGDAQAPSQSPNPNPNPNPNPPSSSASTDR